MSDLALLGSELLQQIRQLNPMAKAALTQSLIQEQQQELNRQIMDQLENSRAAHLRAEEERAEIREKIKQVEDAGARRAKASDQYVIRKVIGQKFSPAISDIRMTKLLKTVGILTQFGEPMMEYQKGHEPIAKPAPHSEYGTWIFHTGKTIKKINNWLDEHGYFDDFHNTATKEERDSIIDQLYEEWT
jgi:hypothetical protein